MSIKVTSNVTADISNEKIIDDENVREKYLFEKQQDNNLTAQPNEKNV